MTVPVRTNVNLQAIYQGVLFKDSYDPQVLLLLDDQHLALPRPACFAHDHEYTAKDSSNGSRSSTCSTTLTMEQPGPPPEALLPGYDMPDKGPIVIGLNIALMTVSTGLVVSRFYVRQFMTKNLGPDDWVSLLALVGNPRPQLGRASKTDLSAGRPNSTIGNGYAYGIQWCRTTHLRCSRGSTGKILQDAAYGAVAIFHRLFDYSNGDSTVPAPACSLLSVSTSKF